MNYYISLFVLAFLAFASAQNENFIRETSYYSDSQCTAATILSAHAVSFDYTWRRNFSNFSSLASS
jgi:hypothetical protein